VIVLGNIDVNDFALVLRCSELLQHLTITQSSLNTVVGPDWLTTV